MAITRQDCILLLTDLQKHGIETKEQLIKAVKNSTVQLDIIDFINKNRPFEVSLFYDKIRKSYNNKKSQLYKNIVKSDEQNPKDILITLGSLNLQILLFAKQCENQNLFLRSARFDEIQAVMLNYSKTLDLVPCIKLLNMIKADLKAFESLKSNNK